MECSVFYYSSKVQSSKFFIPIKGPEGHTDNTATYTVIIKTHTCSIEQLITCKLCMVTFSAKIKVRMIGSFVDNKTTYL
jgi:hypothetical protein